MQNATIGITGMSCGHCVAGVRRALDQLEGVDVREVKVGSATVAYDPQTVDVGRITRAIEEEGYGAQVQGTRS